MMSDKLIDQAAKITGLDKTKSASIINQFLPSIIGGLINKAKSEEGADSLYHLLTKNKASTPNFEDGQSTNDTAIINEIFGNKSSMIIEILSGISGIDKKAVTSLLNFLIPILSGRIYSEISTKNWTKTELRQFLNDQRPIINKKNPGLFKILEADSDSVSKTSALSLMTSSPQRISKIIWIIPMIIITIGFWYFMSDKNNYNKGDHKATPQILDSSDQQINNNISSTKGDTDTEILTDSITKESNRNPEEIILELNENHKADTTQTLSRK
jgi:hypothetical protein